MDDYQKWVEECKQWKQGIKDFISEDKPEVDEWLKGQEGQNKFQGNINQVTSVQL